MSLDGYMPWFGHRILAGEIPYRDFFLHLPPLQPLGEAALEALFGPSILAGRIVGALGKVLVASLVAGWLARRVRPAIAVLATMAAVTLASSDDTVILDLYNAHASLLGVACAVLASRALGGGRRAGAFWLASGAAAAASFWIKQTVGLAVTAAVPLSLAVLAFGDRDRREALRRGATRYASGWALVSLALGGWLAANGALGDFVHQVFLDAAGSKGSPLTVLLRPWMAPFELQEMAWPAVAAFGAAVFPLLFGAPGSRAEKARRSVVSAVAGAAVAVLLIRLGEHVGDTLPGRGARHDALEQLRHIRDFAGLWALYGITALAALLGWRAARRRLADDEPSWLLFAIVAGAIAAGHAASFGVGGTQTQPALALVIAWALGGAARFRGAALARLVPCALAAVVLVGAVALHRAIPFSFALWREPSPWRATEIPREPALAGMRLSRETLDIVDGTLWAIRTASDPGEPIFTFSVYPIFYWLADRPAATFASLHWIDVTPDPVVDADLARLLAEPPVVIVRQAIPEAVLRLNEWYFRNGQESALRRMNDALARLLTERYVEIYESPGRQRAVGSPLEVWVLAERAAERGLKPARRPARS